MFIELDYEEKIVAKSYGCSPNLSSIYTKLIQDTGRFVEHYASDLLIDIKHVQEWEDNVYNTMKNSYGRNTVNIPTEIYYFGLRQYGVDHIDFIKCRHNNEYRKIYKLTLSCENGYVKAELCQVEKID